MIKGAIHSIETFGSVDGPGVRFLIFLKGCNMRCRYCHNVDTWDGKSEDMRSAEELLDMAERYRAYWGKDGGITVSGGEALLQIDFLLELFKEAKKRGMNTCLDTSAQPYTTEEPFYSKFVELMDYTDTVLLDLKHIDSEEHKKLTGHPNENILECARYLSERNIPVWIRHVLVPGVTDDDVYLKQFFRDIEMMCDSKGQIAFQHIMSKENENLLENIGQLLFLTETSFSDCLVNQLEECVSRFSGPEWPDIECGYKCIVDSLAIL